MELTQVFLGLVSFAGGILAASWFGARIAVRYALITDQDHVARFLRIASAAWAVALVVVIAITVLNAYPYREAATGFLYWFLAGLVTTGVAVSAWNGICRLFGQRKSDV